MGGDALGQELHRGRIAVLAPANLHLEPVASGEVGHGRVAHAPDARVVVDRDLPVAAEGAAVPVRLVTFMWNDVSPGDVRVPLRMNETLGRQLSPVWLGLPFASATEEGTIAVASARTTIRSFIRGSPPE